MRQAVKPVIKLFQTIVLLVLALLYTAGSLQIDSIHRLIHKHSEREKHTPEQERNACHRVVYHNQSQGACEHPTHFSESKKCPLCNGTTSQAALISAGQQVTGILAAPLPARTILQSASREHPALLPARAPPGAA